MDGKDTQIHFTNMGGPWDFSVSPKSFFLGKGSDLDQGLTILGIGRWLNVFRVSSPKSPGDLGICVISVLGIDPLVLGSLGLGLDQYT